MAVCSLCNPGSSSPQGSQQCRYCSVGEVQPQAGQARCIKCTSGLFQELEAKPTCDECPEGKFQSKAGQGYCLNNPAGKSVKSQQQQETTMTLDGVDMASFSSDAVQLAFRQKIADRLGVDVSLISLGNITETGRRRLLAGGITFTIVIMASPANEPVPAPVPSRSAGYGSASSYYTAAAASPALAAVSFAELLQSSADLKSMITEVYQAENLQVPNMTVTASAPKTETLIVELICPAGKFFPPGTNTSECLLCPKGKYQDVAGSEICKGRTPCAPGTFLAKEDHAGNAAPPDLCAACPAGTMSLESDTANCTACSVGQYQPEPGTVFCNTCPPHATTDGGAASVLDCKCDPKYFMVANGTWIKGVWRKLSRPQCQLCVDGADCSQVGTTVGSLKTKPGFWRAGIYTIHFDDLSCDETTCTGGTFVSGSSPRNLKGSERTVISEPSDAQCAEGQSGLMCSMCDTNNRWARHMGAKCIKCAGSIGADMAKIVFALVGISVLVYLVAARVVKPLIKRLLQKMTPTQLRKQIYKRQMKVKILLAFIQVGSRLQGTFRLKMPPVVKSFLSSMQVLEFFDVFSMILKYVSCAYPTDYYTKVYTQVQ